MQKYKVTFKTSSSNFPLTETVEGSSWQYAKLKLESRYSGVQILTYSPING
jgi:hypothetical protein|tara:strand:+ start:1049 stop:1201 length:153 start_codon:yes stop_codon:yes gene_type:complete